MVLSLLIETSVFVVQKVYCLGYYLIYGHQETSEEKLDKLISRIEMLERRLNPQIGSPQIGSTRTEPSTLAEPSNN